MPEGEHPESFEEVDFMRIQAHEAFAAGFDSGGSYRAALHPNLGLNGISDFTDNPSAYEYTKLLGLRAIECDEKHFRADILHRGFRFQDKQDQEVVALPTQAEWAAVHDVSRYFQTGARHSRTAEVCIKIINKKELRALWARARELGRLGESLTFETGAESRGKGAFSSPEMHLVYKSLCPGEDWRQIETFSVPEGTQRRPSIQTEAFDTWFEHLKEIAASGEEYTKPVVGSYPSRIGAPNSEQVEKMVRSKLRPLWRAIQAQAAVFNLNPGKKQTRFDEEMAVIYQKFGAVLLSRAEQIAAAVREQMDLYDEARVYLGDRYDSTITAMAKSCFPHSVSFSLEPTTKPRHLKKQLDEMFDAGGWLTGGTSLFVLQNAVYEIRQVASEQRRFLEAKAAA